MQDSEKEGQNKFFSVYSHSFTTSKNSISMRVTAIYSNSEKHLRPEPRKRKKEFQLRFAGCFLTVMIHRQWLTALGNSWVTNTSDKIKDIKPIYHEGEKTQCPSPTSSSTVPVFTAIVMDMHRTVTTKGFPHSQKLPAHRQLCHSRPELSVTFVFPDK